MAENVTININANDKASTNIRKVTMNLREMGEKIGNIGRSMTMAFTVPIVGMVASLTKFGASASETVANLANETNQAAAHVADVQAKLNRELVKGEEASADSIASLRSELAQAQGEYDKTLVAMDNVSLGTKRAAKAYNELQEALIPVKSKLSDISATLLEALVPAIERAIPLLMGFLDNIKGLTTWFSNLAPETQNVIIGFFGLVAIAGPALMMIGNLIKTVAALQALLGAAGLAGSLPVVAAGIKGLGVAAYAALGPWGLLAAAVAGLIYTVITYGPGALQTLDQLVLMAGRLAFGNDWFNTTRKQMGRASGGPVFAGVPVTVGESGSETFVPNQSGIILPHGSGAGGVNVYLTYAPVVGIANQLEAETKLAPYIKAALRKAGY